MNDKELYIDMVLYKPIGIHRLTITVKANKFLNDRLKDLGLKSVYSYIISLLYDGDYIVSEDATRIVVDNKKCALIFFERLCNKIKEDINYAGSIEEINEVIIHNF